MRQALSTCLPRRQRPSRRRWPPCGRSTRSAPETRRCQPGTPALPRRKAVLLTLARAPLRAAPSRATTSPPAGSLTQISMPAPAAGCSKRRCKPRWWALRRRSPSRAPRCTHSSPSSFQLSSPLSVLGPFLSRILFVHFQHAIVLDDRMFQASSGTYSPEPCRSQVHQTARAYQATPRPVHARAELHSGRHSM